MSDSVKDAEPTTSVPEHSTENTPQTEAEVPQPIGAIVVTGVLLGTILAFWFGVYLINWVRGGAL